MSACIYVCVCVCLQRENSESLCNYSEQTAALTGRSTVMGSSVQHTELSATPAGLTFTSILWDTKRTRHTKNLSAALILNKRTAETMRPFPFMSKRKHILPAALKKPSAVHKQGQCSTALFTESLGC